MSDLPMPPLSKQQMQEAREAFNMFDKVRQVTSACTDNLGFLRRLLLRSYNIYH